MPWLKLTDTADNVFDVAIHGRDAYLSTSMGATRFRVLHVNLADVNGAREVFIEEQPKAFIESGSPGAGLNAAQDALYVSYMQDGVSRLMRMPYMAKQKSGEFLNLPASGAFGSLSAETSLPGVVYSWSTWTAPAQRFYADGKETQAILVDQATASADKAKPITVEEVQATGKDGTTIPLTILHNAGMAMDGSHPLLLQAYGAYGITSSPNYSPALLVWINRGYIVAVAHVRGGGERGEPWHLAGYKATKHNTWEDAIACAEYLDAHKYTSPAHTAIWGGSAGGIMVGRSLEESPDLFAAAIDLVPLSDTLRVETEPNGPPNIPEFGTTKTEDGFKALYAMSPYEHIKPGTKYPAVLLLTGANDPRVSPAQPAKMTARLQAATTSGRPVLLRVDYDAGHNTSTMTTRQTAELAADYMSFVLWQTGVRIFNRPATKLFRNGALRGKKLGRGLSLFEDEEVVLAVRLGEIVAGDLAEAGALDLGSDDGLVEAMVRAVAVVINDAEAGAGLERRAQVGENEAGDGRSRGRPSASGQHRGVGLELGVVGRA